METAHCSFCEHSNPADAKFCNACGSSLALRLCEACGAIDNVSATTCHKCGHPFAPLSHVAASDEGETQSVTPAAQAEGNHPRGRSPWKLFVLLVLIGVGTLVIYPRVAGEEAAIQAPVDVEAEAEANLPPPDSPPGVVTEATSSEVAADPEDLALPSTDAAPEPIEEAAASPTEAPDETQTEPPSPTDTSTESAQEEVSAPTTSAQPMQAPAADAAEPPAPNPQATPAGCSPAIDALGLCN